MFHVLHPGYTIPKITLREPPPLLPIQIFGTWKIFEKFPAGGLLHDPMKEYNMRNMKKYVKNMKESLPSYIVSVT